MSSDIVKLDYTEKDYNAILTQLKEKIPELTDQWTDFLESDIGWAIVRLFAGLTDLNNFYLDRQAAETYLSTCTDIRSAVAISKMLGYSPRLTTAAATSLRVSLSGIYNKDIYINYGTQLVIAAYPFTVVEDGVIPSGELSTEVLVKQGKSYNVELTSPGQPWYKFFLPSTITEVIVAVDGEIWTAVDSFIYTVTPNCYRIYRDREGVSIQFGGGITSNIPSAGVKIKALGIISDGAAGNVYNTISTIQFIDPIYDSENRNVNVLLSSSMVSAAVSGSDPESIESIKDNAPAYFTTQNRVTTGTDYAAVAKTVPGVIGATSWGGEEVDRYGEAFVCVYGTDRTYVPQSLLDNVTTELDVKRMIPIVLRVIAPVPLKLYLTIDVYVTRFSSHSTARNFVVSTLNTFIDGLDIGEMLQNSDLISGLTDSPDIDYLNLTMSCEIDESIDADLLTAELSYHVDESTITIVRQSDSETIWSLASSNGSDYTLRDNILTVSITGDATPVYIRYKSKYSDVYPIRGQIIVINSTSINMFNSQQPT